MTSRLGFGQPEAKGMLRRNIGLSHAEQLLNSFLYSLEATI